MVPTSGLIASIENKQIIFMNEKELWKYFWDRKICHSRPLDRDFIWITKEDFRPVRRYFVSEFNFFHYKKESLRSQGLLFHIHVIEQGDYLFVHKDTGNVARFFPLGLIHLICDVVPYFVFAKIKRVEMKSIFVRPE